MEVNPHWPACIILPSLSWVFTQEGAVSCDVDQWLGIACVVSGPCLYSSGGGLQYIAPAGVSNSQSHVPLASSHSLPDLYSLTILTPCFTHTNKTAKISLFIVEVNFLFRQNKFLI